MLSGDGIYEVQMLRRQLDELTAQMIGLRQQSWTKFSAQTSCGEQDGGYSAEIPDRLHGHSNSGRERNSAMYHIRRNAQWSCDQVHVRPERWL